LLLAVLQATALGADWVRPGLNTNQPVWGLRGRLLFAIPPGGFSGGDGGPRGLIRLGYPTLPGGGYDLINFIAVEPVVGKARGFSELEKSRFDGKQGRLFWTGEAPSTNGIPEPLRAGVISAPQPGVEELTVPLRVEKFANGAHVRLTLSQRSDAPDELRLTVHAEPGSTPLDACILTATMGNKARTRQLWVKDGPASSLKLFGDYAGTDFTPHAFFPLERLPRNAAGDAVIALTNDEADPAAATGPARFWQYRGAKVTQYWRQPASSLDDSLRCAVNARFTYWMSKNPIPGGLAFENFELVQRFREGQQFIFGITKRSPGELLK
jgi:hypothetical protein